MPDALRNTRADTKNSRLQTCAVAPLIVLVLLAGMVYSHKLSDTLRYPDERDYVNIARSILNYGIFSSDGVNPTAYRPPGYPFLLTIAAYFGGEIQTFRVLNFVMLSASLVLVFVLARKQGGFPAGVISVILVLCYPVVFYTASTVYPQTMAALLMLTVIWLYFKEDVLTAERALAIGILTGLLLLTAPAFVFFLLFLCVCVLLEQGGSVGAKVLVLLLATVLVMSPWFVRNYRTFNSFVFVSTNSGVNLLLGNSEDTTPNAGVNVDITKYAKEASGLNEVARNRYYTAEALKYVKNNPGRAVRLYLFKFLNYFNYRNRLKTRSESSRLRELVMLLTYGPLFLAGLARVALARRLPLSRYERFALLLYGLNGAFSAVFFTRIRFRVPFDFLLISVCAVFFARATGYVRRFQ